VLVFESEALRAEAAGGGGMGELLLVLHRHREDPEACARLASCRLRAGFVPASCRLQGSRACAPPQLRPTARATGSQVAAAALWVLSNLSASEECALGTLRPNNAAPEDPRALARTAAAR
jgi:hypothetical protein